MKKFTKGKRKKVEDPKVIISQEKDGATKFVVGCPKTPLEEYMMWVMAR